MSVAALLAAVQAALPSAVASNINSSTDAWDLYEAYTFAQVVEAARADGYAVTLRSIRRGPPPQFVFRLHRSLFPDNSRCCFRESVVGSSRWILRARSATCSPKLGPA